ncbi:MAG TPA: Gfo/Idh/MocA family oxidoreductase [Fimbriimonadaceae bacterium]|nr:Gfo/Idh/MocA family oxidoreductase [Fimbriimonadaceae bacterium]
MRSKVRLGFVGVGNMGQCAHLRNYGAIPDCEVVALAEPKPELARKVAARYGVRKTYVDADSLIEAEAPDALVAIQPFDRHGSIVKPLYRHGLPILTEKPLASSLETGAATLQALRAGGSWHMVGYHKRCDPATVAAKAEIDRLKGSGELGRMRYVRITMPEGDWIAGGFNDLIRSDEPAPPVPPDPAEPGMDAPTFDRYVAFVNYYIHQVNLLRHLLGEPYEVVHADPGGILLTVRSESGVTGAIEMCPYRTTVDWHECALVGFERGFVRLELPAPLATNRPGRVEFFRDPGGKPAETVSPTLPWVHAMRAQAEAFVAAVRGERNPPCEAAEALEDLRIARDYIRLLDTQTR